MYKYSSVFSEHLLVKTEKSYYMCNEDTTLFERKHPS